MARVFLENVVKKFGDVEVVRNVTMEIKDREFVVFVGPSGCGKTTTLRMVAGLEEITEGKIYIGDRAVNDVPPKDRDIAMVFQNYALYPHMNVYNNMAFGLKLRRLPRREIDRRVDEAAEILGLTGLLNRMPKQLSGGQRQRVALGRAIVRIPKVFLMDEPLSNLDAKLRVQMRAEIKKLHHRLQSTIIYVTHDQVEAMTLGDRVAVMLNGIMQQVDNPLTVYEHPGNRFVAGFIGSPPMNFLDGVLEQQKDQIAFSGQSIRLDMPADLRDLLREHVGHEVVLGIRPEDIYDTRHVDPELVTASMSAKVDFRELMGSETFVYLKVGPTPLVAKLPALSDFPAGSRLNISIHLNKLHLFDKKNQNVIL